MICFSSFPSNVKYFSVLNATITIILYMIFYISFCIRVGPIHFQEHFLNTSLAIFIIVGAKQNLSVDLRGRFWEHQLNEIPEKYKNDQIFVNYLSDDNISIPGIDITTPYNFRTPIQDKNLFIRTSDTWLQFVRNYPNVKWLFRGVHDTYINLTNMLDLIHNLELQSNPMKDKIFQFGLFEFTNFLYPHGGSGYLSSNAATRFLLKNIGHYRFLSRFSLGDDVGLYDFFRDFGLDVKSGFSTKFIPLFPPQMVPIMNYSTELLDTIPKCPQKYYSYPNASGLSPAIFKKAAAIHMHNVPMNKVEEVLQRIPDNIAYQFPNRFVTYCKY